METNQNSNNVPQNSNNNVSQNNNITLSDQITCDAFPVATIQASFRMNVGNAEVRVPIPGNGENSDDRSYGATVNPGTPGGPPPAYAADKPPPTYAEVTDVNGPPPSYESLYGEFRQVNSPKGFLYFLRKAIGFIVGTVLAAILVAIISLIPIAMIVIGSKNINNCPVEDHIPIYLIVGGVFGLLKSLMNFVYRIKGRDPNRNPEENVNQNPFDGILNCFLLAWFIAGSYWVYHVYLPSFNPVPANYHQYCDKLTYYFTFCLITITYVMMSLFLWLMCCCGCLAICCGRSQGQEND